MAFLQRVSPRARLTSTIYLAAVAACIFLAFDFEGQIHAGWTLVLIFLTLPASSISILFAWALIHGAALVFFALVYMASAGLNVLVANWLFAGKTKKR